MHLDTLKYNLIFDMFSLQGLSIDSVDAGNAEVALAARAIFVMCSKHLYHSS
jgi:hypothetical protein